MTAGGPVVTAGGIPMEWKKVSEKETSLRAARNALRFCFWGLAWVVMLGFFFAYRGWVWRVLDWMSQFPLPRG